MSSPNERGQVFNSFLEISKKRKRVNLIVSVSSQVVYDEYGI